jgi:hypothetical protein
MDTMKWSLRGRLVKKRGGRLDGDTMKRFLRRKWVTDMIKRSWKGRWRSVV